MFAYMWDEYARLQRLVGKGFASEEQLNAFLVRALKDNHQFDLYDCRRWLKNLGRNLGRKSRDQRRLLETNAIRIGPTRVESPLSAVIRRETCADVRRLAGDDWELLCETVDGDYAAITERTGKPVGTIKSQVSRGRRRLRATLSDSF